MSTVAPLHPGLFMRVGDWYATTGVAHAREFKWLAVALAVICFVGAAFSLAIPISIGTASYFILANWASTSLGLAMMGAECVRGFFKYRFIQKRGSYDKEAKREFKTQNNEFVKFNYRALYTLSMVGMVLSGGLLVGGFIWGVDFSLKFSSAVVLASLCKNWLQNRHDKIVSEAHMGKTGNKKSRVSGRIKAFSIQIFLFIAALFGAFLSVTTGNMIAGRMSLEEALLSIKTLFSLGWMEYSIAADIARVDKSGPEIKTS